MTAQRARYCTFVACLKPVMDEEMGCFGEVAQLEDVMAKLGKVRFMIDVIQCEQRYLLQVF